MRLGVLDDAKWHANRVSPGSGAQVALPGFAMKP
jgi:hypothetical protein